MRLSFTAQFKETRLLPIPKRQSSFRNVLGSSLDFSAGLRFRVSGPAGTQNRLLLGIDGAAKVEK